MVQGIWVFYLKVMVKGREYVRVTEAAVEGTWVLGHLEGKGGAYPSTVFDGSVMPGFCSSQGKCLDVVGIVYTDRCSGSYVLMVCCEDRLFQDKMLCKQLLRF